MGDFRACAEIFLTFIYRRHGCEIGFFFLPILAVRLCRRLTQSKSVGRGLAPPCRKQKNNETAGASPRPTIIKVVFLKKVKGRLDLREAWGIIFGTKTAGEYDRLCGLLCLVLFRILFCCSVVVVVLFSHGQGARVRAFRLTRVRGGGI